MWASKPFCQHFLSLFLSLWNVCNAITHVTFLFELLLRWCCILTYMSIFLRVGVRVHSLNVLLKLRVRAILTETWIHFAHLRFLESHLLLYFNLLWKTMHPYFHLLCQLFLNLEWLIYQHLSIFFGSFYPNSYSCNELERLLSECKCFVLLLSQQFSLFKVDWMLHNAPNILFSPLSKMKFFFIFILVFAWVLTFTKVHLLVLNVCLDVIEMSLQLGTACLKTSYDKIYANENENSLFWMCF